MNSKKVYTILSIISVGMLIYTTRKNFTAENTILMPENFDDSAINFNPFDGIIWEATMSIYQPRGIRNNNPFNIRRTSDKWLGLSPEQNDPSFFQFISAEYGIRAGCIILKNYYYRYGLITVQQIINRFAPPVENNTSAYVNSVASALGVAPNEHINIETEIYKLANAIIKHENGINPYSQTVVSNGVVNAGMTEFVV